MAQKPFPSTLTAHSFGVRSVGFVGFSGFCCFGGENTCVSDMPESGEVSLVLLLGHLYPGDKLTFT